MRELSEKDVELILNAQKEYFDLQVTKNTDYRIHQLIRLKKGIKKYEPMILNALKKDLGKHENESYMSEIGYIYNSISFAIRNIKHWAKPKKCATPWYLMPAKSYVLSEPYGAVLIIGPYNYPFHLLIEPLIGAIAAGNTAILKPSEMAPNMSRIVKVMIEEIFDSRYIACVEGGVDTNTSLLNNAFDYIFFTGSVNVGKIVMKAAAKRLIPVTLELGGKSPVIVDKSANLKEAARRIIWGKTMNAGQTCIAPDYILVYETVKEDLIKELKLAIGRFYGQQIQQSDSFGRIINQRHFQRISSILEKDKKMIIFGGHTDEKERYIEPTLLDVPNLDAACMQEELFGPILPIMTYASLNDAITQINSMPKPLALYLFTRDKCVIDKVMLKVSSGGVCINDTLSHLANYHLPFGGVGNSGIGGYHGIESFQTFSHKKSVLRRPSGIGSSITYPSYTARQLKLIRMIMK